ncbi:MAG: DUF58 domain-containing protein [Planctomycetes bacterium]|nr:DUF58 domain-containing protein [Planctomycetota bacterium]
MGRLAWIEIHATGLWAFAQEARYDDTVNLAPTGRQLTALLDNRTLNRLERMRLNPVRRLTNRSHGEHLAGKGGSSTEFSDYRNYVHGDDTRYVDWNIFARLHRPFMKLYRYEEELHVVLLVDASTSMLVDNKLLRATQLAAALGMLGLLNVERVSAYSCNHRGSEPRFMQPTTGRAGMQRLFAFLEAIEGGGDFPIEEAVEAVLRRHRGRGVAIVLSDFLTLGDLVRPFNLLYSAGLETCAVQVLSPAEIDPELSGDLRLVDSETGVTLDVSSAESLLGLYHEHRQALADELSTLCRQRRGRFVSVNSAEPLEQILFDTFRRQGWVR